MKSRVTMKTRLCPHQHLWVLFLYCSPTLNTNYAWSVSVCACMCVHVCVCVCEGWRRRLPPVLDSNLQPLNLHIKPSILKPSAGGLTRWDGIDRIGLDMMSGSSGVVCTLQAACSQEERGRGGRWSQPQPVPRYGHPLSYHVLYCSTDCFQFSFFPRMMVEVWDSLPWSWSWHPSSSGWTALIRDMSRCSMR